MADVADLRPLEVGREERAAVVHRAAEVGRRVDRDVARDVLVLGPQPVQQPRPQRRPRLRGELRPGVELDHGLRVRGGVGVQAADEAELVDVPRDVRVQLGDPRPGLAVLRELELRPGQRPAPGADLAVVLLELRLVVERVHLGHRPVHEQEDDPLGLHREVRRPRRQRARGRQVRRAGLRRGLAEQPGQGQHAEAGPGVAQDLPPREAVDDGEFGESGHDIDPRVSKLMYLCE